MGYQLDFFAVDLNNIRSKLELQHLLKQALPNDILIENINTMGDHLGCISHASGSGRLFEEYISNIAGNYFDEPSIFNLMMDRKDVYPYTEGLEWGYLIELEIKKFIHAAEAKNPDEYFEDNEDFEEDLESLHAIFEEALKKGKDLICIYA